MVLVPSSPPRSSGFDSPPVIPFGVDFCAPFCSSGAFDIRPRPFRISSAIGVLLQNFGIRFLPQPVPRRRVYLIVQPRELRPRHGTFGLSLRYLPARRQCFFLQPVEEVGVIGLRHGEGHVACFEHIRVERTLFAPLEELNRDDSYQDQNRQSVDHRKLPFRLCLSPCRESSIFLKWIAISVMLSPCCSISSRLSAAITGNGVTLARKALLSPYRTISSTSSAFVGSLMMSSCLPAWMSSRMAMGMDSMTSWH